MAEFNPFGQLMEVQKYKQNLVMKQDQIARQNAIQDYQMNRQARADQNAIAQGRQAREAAQRRQMGVEMTLGNVPPERRQEELVSRGYLQEAGQVAGLQPKPPASTNLAKLIAEREQFRAKLGEDHEIVTVYDNKILGADADMEDLTQDQIDVMGSIWLKTGINPVKGRGKLANKLKIGVVASGTNQALGLPTVSPEGAAVAKATMTPQEAASNVILNKADTKGLQGSVAQQQKQLGSMRSFVFNIGKQVDRVISMEDKVKTADARMLNKPWRFVFKKMMGSADLAKYDMYIGEIEEELGKLASGATGSVAALTDGAREKWSNIHDKNLSFTDMVELLKETKHAGTMRLDSVQEGMDISREELRNVGKKKPSQMQGWSIKKVQ